MKRNIFCLGILALALVFVMTVVGCDNGSTKGNDNGKSVTVYMERDTADNGIILILSTGEWNSSVDEVNGNRIGRFLRWTEISNIGNPNWSISFFEGTSVVLSDKAKLRVRVGDTGYLPDYNGSRTGHINFALLVSSTDKENFLALTNLSLEYADNISFVGAPVTITVKGYGNSYW